MFHFYDDDHEPSYQSPRFTQSLAFPFLFTVLAPLILAMLGFFMPVEIGFYVLFCAAPLAFLFGAIWFCVWALRVC
jgi:hypothetical protein